MLLATETINYESGNFVANPPYPLYRITLARFAEPGLAPEAAPE